MHFEGFDISGGDDKVNNTNLQDILEQVDIDMDQDIEEDLNLLDNLIVSCDQRKLTFSRSFSTDEGVKRQ